ncbi:MAG: hypothetical protein QM522_10790 [Chitinophagaceae bacterium]|nr:hypothetical protein [Chitinophagaceae bacterium]
MGGRTAGDRYGPLSGADLVTFIPDSTRPLRLGAAVEDGWRAFSRSPWPFVLFTLLSGGLSLLFQALTNLDALPEASQPATPLLVSAVIVGTVGQVIVNLWGTVGLIRGAWTALNGDRPGWNTFSRWDGRASGRLLLRQLTLGVLVLVVLLAAGILMFGLAQLQPWLAALPAVAALVVLIYLLVGQSFLPWVALLEGPGPLATLQRGREGVDPQWWWVLLLALLQGAILLVGALLCGVGLLAAAPLAVCISTAAYRQLFGSEDRTGLLSESPNSLFNG